MSAFHVAIPLDQYYICGQCGQWAYGGMFSATRCHVPDRRPRRRASCPTAAGRSVAVAPPPPSSYPYPTHPFPPYDPTATAIYYPEADSSTSPGSRQLFLALTATPGGLSLPLPGALSPGHDMDFSSMQTPFVWNCETNDQDTHINAFWIALEIFTRRQVQCYRVIRVDQWPQTKLGWLSCQ